MGKQRQQRHQQQQHEQRLCRRGAPGVQRGGPGHLRRRPRQAARGGLRRVGRLPARRRDAGRGRARRRLLLRSFRVLLFFLLLQPLFFSARPAAGAGPAAPARVRHPHRRRRVHVRQGRPSGKDPGRRGGREALRAAVPLAAGRQRRHRRQCTKEREERRCNRRRPRFGGLACRQGDALGPGPAAVQEGLLGRDSGLPAVVRRGAAAELAHGGARRSRAGAQCPRRQRQRPLFFFFCFCRLFLVIRDHPDRGGRRPRGGLPPHGIVADPGVRPGRRGRGRGRRERRWRRRARERRRRRRIGLPVVAVPEKGRRGHGLCRGGLARLWRPRALRLRELRRGRWRRRQQRGRRRRSSSLGGRSGERPLRGHPPRRRPRLGLLAPLARRRHGGRPQGLLLHDSPSPGFFALLFVVLALRRLLRSLRRLRASSPSASPVAEGGGRRRRRPEEAAEADDAPGGSRPSRPAPPLFFFFLLCRC